jgi:hypothetical protein
MTHDQVRQLVRRINPIPDPSVLETVDVPVPIFERSMDMQVDDRPLAQEHRKDRWRGPMIGIAAAAVVLMVGVIYIYTEREPVAAPAPNAMALPGVFEPIAPGAYFADTDDNEETATRGTFVIEGNGWESLEAGVWKETFADEEASYVSLFVVEVAQVWEAPCDGGAAVPAGTTAKALGDQFAAMPAFTTLEGLAPISAFGHDGYHLVREVPAGCITGEQSVWSGGAWGDRYYQAEGQIVEYWFLDVEDTTVMVEANSFPESFEGDVAEFRAVIDTLVITP